MGMTAPIRVLALMESSLYGGPAVNLVETALLLHDRVHTEVATFVRGTAAGSEFTAALVHKHIPCHVVHERFRYDPAAIVQLQKIIKETRPDIIQAHNTKSRLFLRVLGAWHSSAERPVIDFFHGETWEDAKQRLYNRLDRFLFSRSRQIVCVAHFQKKMLTSWGIDPERVTVVHNGIVAERLQNGSAAPPSGRRVILSVGRLSPEKGHLLLLEAFAALAAAHPDPILVLVGDGIEKEKIKRSVAAKKLENRVELAGYQPDPTPFYHSARLFVLPSLSEGLPNVLLEASCHGLPIVAFDSGGVTEVIRNGQEGRVVGEKTATALARAMDELLRDPAGAGEMARQAQARVKRHFSMAARSRAMLACYRSLLPKPHVA